MEALLGEVSGAVKGFKTLKLSSSLFMTSSWALTFNS